MLKSPVGILHSGKLLLLSLAGWPPEGRAQVEELEDELFRDLSADSAGDKSSAQ